MLQVAIEDVIRENLVPLTERLVNTLPVVNLLIQEGKLTIHEKDVIMSTGTSLERNTELFTMLMKKEIDEDLLVSVLTKTGNDHLSPIILSTYQKLLNERNSSFLEQQNMDWSTVPEPQQAFPSNPTTLQTFSDDNTSSHLTVNDDNQVQSVDSLLKEQPVSPVTNIEQSSLISIDSLPKSLLNFDDIKLIGEGAYGKIFNVKDKSSRNIFAIKIAKEVECHRERKNLAKVRHPNIITYIASWEETANDELKKLDAYRTWLKGYRTLYCIQTEWCDGGNLETWMSEANDKNLPDTKRICYQITLGVEYLHNHKDKLLHRDLKPDNIFLLHEYEPNSRNLIVKMGDLGLCRATLQRSKRSRAHLMTTRVGNKTYMAPEVSDGKEDYTTAVDIFAIGLIFYDLIMSTTELDPEFDSKNNVITSQWFIDTFRNEKLFLQNMLLEDANKRPLAGDVRTFLCQEWQLENTT